MCGVSYAPDGELARRPLIVVLDEDEALREALRFSLETEGYRVSVFGAAEALLACWHRLGAACFVLDEPACDSRLRALLQRRRVPVILMSARRAPPRPGGGKVRVVEKPLMTDALSRQIALALAAGQSPTSESQTPQADSVQKQQKTCQSGA